MILKIGFATLRIKNVRVYIPYIFYMLICAAHMYCIIYMLHLHILCAHVYPISFIVLEWSSSSS